jgi:3-phenylpropionate/trans-cinnamate dioxygenase ferredoxin subunit
MPSFRPALKAADLPAGESRLVRISGKEVLLVSLEGEVHALSNACPHAGGPLHQGRLEGDAIVCPLHGARFDCKDGSVLRGPARSGLLRYPSRIEGEWIQVDVD